MNSEENRRRLALGNGKYILGSKMRAGDEVSKEVLARPGRYQEVREGLRVKEVLVGDGERRRRYVVCHVTHQRHRDDASPRTAEACRFGGGHRWRSDGRSETSGRRGDAWPRRRRRAVTWAGGLAPTGSTAAR